MLQYGKQSGFGHKAIHQKGTASAASTVQLRRLLPAEARDMPIVDHAFQGHERRRK